MRKRNGERVPICEIIICISINILCMHFAYSNCIASAHHIVCIMSGM